eukprot:340967_1
MQSYIENAFSVLEQLRQQIVVHQRLTNMIAANKDLTHIKEVKDKYDNALKKKQSLQQSMKSLLTDLMQIEKKMDVSIEKGYDCINELKVISLKPNFIVENDYIYDTFIQLEQMERQIGWKERIKAMKQLKYKQYILNALANNNYNPWNLNNNYNDVESFLNTNHDVFMECNIPKVLTSL